MGKQKWWREEFQAKRKQQLKENRSGAMGVTLDACHGALESPQTGVAPQSQCHDAVSLPASHACPWLVCGRPTPLVLQTKKSPF